MKTQQRDHEKALLQKKQKIEKLITDKIELDKKRMDDNKVLNDEIDGFKDKLKEFNSIKLALQTKSTELIQLRKSHDSQ